MAVGNFSVFFILFRFFGDFFNLFSKTYILSQCTLLFLNFGKFFFSFFGIFQFIFPEKKGTPPPREEYEPRGLY
jgi:hypothetical protein